MAHTVITEVNIIIDKQHKKSPRPYDWGRSVRAWCGQARL